MGDISETGNPIPGETRIQDLAVLELHLFRERSSQPHDDTTLHLGEEVGGIQNGTTFKGLANFGDLDTALGSINRNLDTGGYNGVLLGPAGQGRPRAQA